MLQRAAGGPEVGVEVPVHHQVPLVIGELGGGLKIFGATGIVDQHVDASERGDRLLDEVLDVRLYGHVAGEERGSLADSEIGQCLLALLGRPSVERHLGALGESRLGDPSSNALGTAGDGDDLVLQLHQISLEPTVG